MRLVFLSFALLLSLTNLQAQKDSTTFKGRFTNEEYKVYLRLNLHQKDVVVPGHDIFGSLPGYMGKVNNNFVWIVTDSKIRSNGKAQISMINDFGSEDLTATFEQLSDSVFVLRQGHGNTIKMPNKGKWQKLPKELRFKKMSVIP